MGADEGGEDGDDGAVGVEGTWRGARGEAPVGAAEGEMSEGEIFVSLPIWARVGNE